MVSREEIPRPEVCDLLVGFPVVGVADVVQQVANLPRLGLACLRVLDLFHNHALNALLGALGKCR